MSRVFQVGAAQVCLWVLAADTAPPADLVAQPPPGDLPIMPRRQQLQQQQQRRLDASPLSPVDETLQNLLQCLASSASRELGEQLVEKLKFQLKVTSGQTAREKGGIQYDPMYVLDSVLLADNVKALGGIGEEDLLADVVRQPKS